MKISFRTGSANGVAERPHTVNCCGSGHRGGADADEASSIIFKTSEASLLEKLNTRINSADAREYIRDCVRIVPDYVALAGPADITLGDLRRLLALLLVEAPRQETKEDTDTRVAAMGDSTDNPTASENQTTPALFRKKPVVITAVQWFSDAGIYHPGVYCDLEGPGRGRPYVVTIHGERAHLSAGDWILPEPDGKSYYPCKPDIFAATYEPIALLETRGVPQEEKEHDDEKNHARLRRTTKVTRRDSPTASKARTIRETKSERYAVLRQFARDMLRGYAGDSERIGDIDGYWLEQHANRLGLLVERHEGYCIAPWLRRKRGVPE